MSASSVVKRIRDLASNRLVHQITGGIVALLCLGYLAALLAQNWNELLTYDWQISFGQFGLAFSYYSVGLGVTALGWGLIVGRFAPDTSLRKHFKYYAYTNLVRRLPAPFLYLLGRMVLYEQEGVSKPLMATTSLLEWILLVVSGLVVCSLTLPFSPLSEQLYTQWILLAILAFGIVLLHPRVIRSILRRLKQPHALVDYRYYNALMWVAVYSMTWIAGGLILFSVLNGLHPLSLTQLPAVIGLWTLSGLATSLAFVISAGFGLKELTLVILLGYLVPSPLPVVAALLMRVCVTLFEIIWALIAMLL